MPKSQSLILPASSNSMLSNFTSLCRTDRQWQWPTLLTTYLKISFASFSGRDRRRFINESKSPPDAYSITRKISSLVSSTSYSLMIFRCLITLSRRISVCTFEYWWSLSCVLLMIFKATDCWVSLCVARATFPNAPLPRSFLMS